MSIKRIAIIGGGASGMVAAIAAAREGAKVVIIEQKDRIGKKILSTGNGRCNLSNEYMVPECFHSGYPKLVKNVLKKFDVNDTLEFFENLGLVTKIKHGGYIYPYSEQATAVLDLLRIELERLQINVMLNTTAVSIQKRSKDFLIETNDQSIKCDALILATGGKAAPVLGSDGSGYALAKSLGHTLVPVLPALVQLKCKGDYFKQLAGIRTEAAVKAVVDEETVAEDKGELQLTNYGISGIPVFQISRSVSVALYHGKKVYVEIDFMPSMDAESLYSFFKTRIKSHRTQTAFDYMVGIFHKKLNRVLLKRANIAPETKVSVLTEENLNYLVQACKTFQVQVADTNSFENAQVCAGGVTASEVDIATLESNCTPGLYLTGEILDVDGICGGYNLQWAWSTGYIAGTCAAGK